MNIKVTDSWLKDYIQTTATPEEIARALSLHSFSVERIEQAPDGDTVYEIEVTPNRGDALSVVGIARELRVVLADAKWNKPEQEVKHPAASGHDALTISIKDTSLVPRFSAVVLDNIQIKDSPAFIRERLEKVGTRTLNSVVDVTNYMMLDKGQPMHAFDFDKIKNHQMKVRESLEGEKVTTLDNVVRSLPKGVIVIEDGDGRLIDLCGIMGAKNSEVDENTKKVLLFVQIYDPVKIRKASMNLGHRTEAALRFEKGIDFNEVISGLWQAVDLLQKYAGATVSSKLYDIVNVKYKPKEVKLDYVRIDFIAGLHIDKERVNKILTSLGFEVKGSKVIVPSWRYDDIDIPEDLAEEVIRIYGYYNIENHIMTGEIPQTTQNASFYWEDLVKTYLKYQGFFECYTYSATNDKNAGENALKLANPLNEDFKALRQTITPQLINVLDKNQSYSSKIKIYELASVYVPKKNDLPEQPLTLALVTKGIDYLDLKGIVYGLLTEMGVNSKEFNVNINSIREGVFSVELNFEELLKHASKVKSYIPLTSLNVIKEDLTFIVPKSVTYQDIQERILGTDLRIYKLAFKDIYENNLTFAIEYLDKTKQISSVDVQEIRKNIFSKLDEDLKVKVKA